MEKFEDSVSRRSLVLSGAALLASARRLFGQDKDTTFTADVKVVSVFATVRDKQGHIVRNLAKDDFSLLEDGRPQTIKYFSQESDLPLTLGLLVDTSMSQRNVLGEEKTASGRFLTQVLREDKDKAFVIHFDREVELLQDLTSSRQKLQESLDQLALPDRPSWGGNGGPNGGNNGGGNNGGGNNGGGWGGRRGGGGRMGGRIGTALYDSVLLASDELMKKQTGRKALIMLSDGVDFGSKVGLSTAIESAQRADTLVYSILFADHERPNNNFGGFGGPRMGGGGLGGGRRGGGGGYPRGGNQGERPDGKKVLERLSRETGGAFFEVSKKQTIEHIYSQIEEDLRNQYSIGYTSDKTEAGGYRKITLATKKTGLVVQTREGYYS